MSIRDYFAGQVLGQIAFAVTFPQQYEDMLKKSGVEVEDFEAWTAHLCYQFADAMLAERAKNAR